MAKPTYAEQTWRFIVVTLVDWAFIRGFDDERDAVQFCLHHEEPAKVVRTSDDETVYYNC